MYRASPSPDGVRDAIVVQRYSMPMDLGYMEMFSQH